MPYPRSYWDAKRAKREKRWREEAAVRDDRESRCTDILPLIHVMEHLYFKPEIPRGFKVGGTHHFE